MNDGNPTADSPVLRIEDHRPEAIRIAHQAAELERLKRLESRQEHEAISAEQGTSVVIASMDGDAPARSAQGAIITSLHESDSQGNSDAGSNLEADRHPNPGHSADKHSEPDELISEVAPEESRIEEVATEEVAADCDAQTTTHTPELIAEAPLTDDFIEIDSTDEPRADEAAAPHADEIAERDERPVSLESQPRDAASAAEEDKTKIAAEATEATAEAAVANQAVSDDAAPLATPTSEAACDGETTCNATEGLRLADTQESKPELETEEHAEAPTEALSADAEAAAAKAAEEEIAAEGLAFIEQIEKKHNQVLDELDALNARIESVLESYLSSRDTGDDQQKAA